MMMPTAHGESDPFSLLELASFLPLEELQGRSKCTVCGASRKFFCYTCCKPVRELEGKIPVIELPIQVDIIKHSLEVDGKSTAVHAMVLAPESVKLYTYPCIPEYADPSKVLLVYPCETAKSLKQLLGSDVRGTSGDRDQLPVQKRQKTRSELSAIPYERVIFIDSTWSQSRKMFADERLRDLPCVVLTERKTRFWRTQDKEDTYLATIEAIYYFLTELYETTSDLPYDGRYDNLMFFFVHMYRIIEQSKKNIVKSEPKRGSQKLESEAKVT